MMRLMQSPGTTVMVDEVKRVLSTAAPFAALDDADRDAFLATCDVVHLSPNEVLFQQGDPGTAIYYVISGRLDVFVQRPNGRQQRLTQLTCGDFTGGMALLAGRTRAATVRAAGAVALLEISAASLESLAFVYPSVKSVVLEVTASRLPMLHLAAMELFRGLDASVLAEFNLASHWLRLPGGTVLFHQGDPGDCLYIVAYGRLEVVVERADGTRESVAHVGRGECIGEMALLTGERRSATVRALRDCELIRLSGDECRRMLAQRPQAILELSQLLVERLRDRTAGRRPSVGVRTIAVAPASDSGLHAHVARELVAALTRQGRRVLHLDRHTVDTHLGAGTADASSEHVLNHRVLRWLGEQEGPYHHVVFQCDSTPSAWSARCLRQADLVLFVADAKADGQPGALEAKLRGGAMGYTETPRELILVHPEGTTPCGTQRWIAPGRFTRHHHVRARGAADYARVARLVTGRANALVLGGGGARGFAHLGVLRAFEEAGIPIDSIGGTSMGAIIGAQYASGYGVDAMIAMTRRSFVDSNPIRDYTVPLVSLITGNRMARVLRRMFGEAQIEDQWLPYYCVATNLSRARLAVHRSGSLAFAVGTSISVPGLAPPLIQDGDFLVDGGLLDNVPVATMRQMASGTVFAVDVSQRIEFTTTREPYTHLSGWRVLRDRLRLTPRREKVPSMLKLLWRSTVLNSVHRAAELQRSVDVYIHPPLDDIEIFDWHALDRAVETGYRSTVDALAKWKR